MKDKICVPISVEVPVAYANRAAERRSFISGFSASKIDFADMISLGERIVLEIYELSTIILTTRQKHFLSNINNSFLSIYGHICLIIFWDLLWFIEKV